MMNNNSEKHRIDCEVGYIDSPDSPMSQHSSLFFSDAQRSIDFILVWKSVDDRTEEDLNCTKRAIFEDNLVKEGLELERETVEELHFTKIHTPIEVLRRYSEILKLRLPMKEVSFSWYFFLPLDALLITNSTSTNLFSVIMFSARAKSIFSIFKRSTFYLK